MRRPQAVQALVAGAAILAASCTKQDPCSSDNLKLETLQLVSNWYLYPDLLPGLVDLDAFAGPADLLDGLTSQARSQGLDRFWSYTTTPAAQQAFFDAGTFVGFGVNLLTRSDGTGTGHLFVSQVYTGSAAELAGFKRGDEIVAIGVSDPLTPASTLIASDTVGDALGPATAGIQRSFDVLPAGGSPQERRTMTKGTYNLDPVPRKWFVIDRSTLIPPLPPAGYVALRSFITPAETPLQEAFTDFKAAGVKDVIVDLRYDGGGRILTAELLSNLLGGGLATKPAFELDYNVFNQASNSAVPFTPVAASLTPDHVAFLVSGATASASELVPNALAPYLPVLLVGHQTYGKPVGQVGFQDSQCGLVVNLVTFRLANSAGATNYYGGLPYTGFPGCSVAADDDLTKDTWDPTEGQTAAALAMLQTLSSGGTCPAAPSPLAVPGSTDSYPAAVGPSEAQRHVRGLF
ncbi:MAG TPA: S41 family peptidase [Anaeromyxobacter sp.]